VNKYKFSERHTCRMCGEEFTQTAFKLSDSPIADSYHDEANHEPKFPLEVFVCSSCGQVQLKHVVWPDEIYKEYIYWTKTSPDLQAHFKQYSNDALVKINKNNGLMVDVGCNDGTLLKNFAKRGWKVCGVEPAENISAYLTKENINHINGYMDIDVALQIVHEHGQADLITCNNVFANVNDTDAFMAAINELLKKDGTFIIEANYLLDMLKNQVFDYIYHEHLSYFSLSSVNALCQRHGMEIYDLQLVNTKGGSFRSYIGFQSKHVIQPIVMQQLAKEVEIGIHSANMFKMWMEDIDTKGRQIKSTLTQLKSDGKTIVGYGASATVTTLIHHFKLTELFDYLVDDNPIKQNTFCPGTHIPVKSSSELAKERNCIIAVTSWRFTDLIHKNNPQLNSPSHIFLRIFPNLEELGDVN
jgi:SAM-dependent methyltransferase